MKKLAKILDSLARISYWILLLTIIALILMTVGMNSMNSEFEQLSGTIIETSYLYQTLNFTRSIEYGKDLMSLNFMCISTVITNIVLIFNICQIRGILEGIIEDQPFNTFVIKYIKRLAWGIMFGSLIVAVVTTISDYYSLQSLNILTDLNQIGADVNLFWSIFEGFFIVEGLLILLLAYIFEHGLQLQQEVDATL